MTSNGVSLALAVGFAAVLGATVFGACAKTCDKAGGECEFPIALADVHTRDPYIVADAATKRYLMFTTYYVEPGTPGSDWFGMTGEGVQVYESKDLEHWSRPKQVLKIPAEFDCSAVWAPEVHSWKGKWYIFTTLNYKKGGRGTWTFVSDDLRGPYRATSDRSITPQDWCALDGTLCVEDGRPYMVFCHEWVQVTNGTICVSQLSDDLSRAVTEPRTLFSVCDGPGVKLNPGITDGPFMHRSKSGALRMLWSSFLPESGYCTLRAESESGKLDGPWGGHEVIFSRDGGHGMVFRDFEGRLRLVIHTPNGAPHERAKILFIDDDLKLAGSNDR